MLEIINKQTPPAHVSVKCFASEMPLTSSCLLIFTNHSNSCSHQMPSQGSMEHASKRGH